MKKDLLMFCALLASFAASAQVSSPFTACPEVVAVVKHSANPHANSPINIYSVNSVTGSATLLSGGPLKDPASNGHNLNLNAAGLNAQDGYLYGLGTTGNGTQNFYRVGSNYSVEQVGVVMAPVVSGANTFSFVNSDAGEFDASGNYFFTAVSGTGTTTGNGSFTPTTFYIGRISNATSLPAGTGNITPVYTPLDFSAAACSDYYSSLLATVSMSTAQNIGLNDLAFNPRDGQLYTYVTYESPAGSGNFFGELLSINSSTGLVTCYTPMPLSFASASNGVIGTAMTTSGVIDILFNNGDVYQTVFTAPNNYSGAIVSAGPSGIGGSIAGDLAACVTANAVLPVNFETVEAIESKCVVNLRFTVAGEQNVNRYDVEQLDNNHYISIAKVNAANDPAEHTYYVNLPVNSKTMILRIRETDNDGRFAYSNALVTVNTTCSQTKSISVIDNATVGSNLQLRWNYILSAENFTVNIYNSAGLLMTKKEVEVSGLSSTTNMDVSKLAPGLYLVMAQSATGEKLMDKFIKK